MRRILSIWLPDLPLERLRRAEPSAVPQAAPFALVVAEGGKLVIGTANADARAAGVGPGQGLADARAIAPWLLSRPAEPARDAAALARLARWLVRYGPAFNTDGPDGLWVDVTGVAHLYGGEAGLMADLVRRLRHFGLTARLGLADGLGAAWALARFAAPGHGSARTWQMALPGQSSAALADLPVEGLRIDPAATELLRRLGLKRIGQLHGLPRTTIERRFRAKVAAVLARLDQALGTKPEPLRPMRVPPKHAARAAFSEPLISGDGLEAALAELARDLSAQLAASHRGARRLGVTLHRCDGTRAVIRAGLSRPSRSTQHMLRLLGEKLGAIDAGFGIDFIELDALITEPMSPNQERLTAETEASARQEEALAALIDRLAGRLGAANVLALMPRLSHLPERAEVLQSLLAASSPPASIGARQARMLRPPLLFATPEPVQVVAAVPEGPPELMRWRRTVARIVRAEGPERIEPEWWREIGAAASLPRDYYMVEDDTGTRFWLFRDGSYGQAREAGGTPAWYLHGVFG